MQQLIYGCATGNTLWVYDNTSEQQGLLPEVTVYGPKFKINGVDTPPQSININDVLTVLSEDGTQVLFSLKIYSGSIEIHLKALTIPVEIDIKPGSDPNPINPGSNGLIPVAILTTDEFDAAVVDPGTVTLAGAEVAVRGKSDKLMARLEDVDEDGDLDLMLQVDTQSDGAVWTNGPVILIGKTYDEQDIEGTDDVIIVPPE